MKLSDAEWQIMNALWQKNPATAREIMSDLPEDVQWAYTTVKTMLSRLVSKSAVCEEKRGNLAFYTPLISQKKARRGAIRSMIDKVFGGTVEPIIHYLIEEQKLTPGQRRELIRMLEETDRKGVTYDQFDQ